jgi:hypothetical protein
MNDKNFLAEIDALLSRLPSMEVFSRFDGPADIWLGQANAVLKSKLHGGEQAELGSLNHAIERGDYLGISRPVAIRGLLRLIHMVRHNLLMASGGTGAVVFDRGMHYQYFEAIRGIIQTATRELFIVDPYLDADVLSRFVGCAGANVSIRLLGKKIFKRCYPQCRHSIKSAAPFSLGASKVFMTDLYFLILQNAIFQADHLQRDRQTRLP